METLNYKNHTIKILHDPCPANPLTEFENLGEITYNPKARILGDVPMSGERVNSILKNKREYIAIPVYAYVHSGATIRASEKGNPFHCPWDSGMSGIIFVLKTKVRNEYGWKKITKARRENIINNLISEVETFDQYLTGQVYGYEVEETGDSCWGYYGNPEESGCIEDAKSVVDYLVTQKDNVQA